MKKTANFAQGAFILMVASAITKVVGAIFKIPLTNIIGADGMGVFSIAYTIYTTLFIISTAGLPVAISKMVAEAYANGKYGRVREILRVSLLGFSLVGVVASVVLTVFAQQFTELVHNSMAYYAVLAVAPSLFFVSIVSIIRGYFQGLSDMVPTGVSQILEALGKLVFGLAFAYLLIQAGYPVEIGAAGAILGVTLGMALATVYLIIKNRKSLRTLPKTQEEKSGGILSALIKTAVPVTIGSAVLSLTNLIDLFLVMGRLQSAAGFTEAMANKLYGAYSMCVSIFNLPQTFVVAIAVSIIPAVATCIAKGNKARAVSTMSSALRIGGCLALPAGVGLLTLADPVLNLLYFNKPDDVKIAIPLMALLGIAVVCVAFVSLSNSILQAAGKVNIPVITMLIGGVIKITCNYVLVGNPDINITGAPIGTIACYGIIALLNLSVIKYLFPDIKPLMILVKPALCAAVMGAFAYFLSPVICGMLGAKLGVLVVIGIATTIYAVLLVVSGGLPKSDILMLPKGDKLVKLLKIEK